MSVGDKTSGCRGARSLFLRPIGLAHLLMLFIVFLIVQLQWVLKILGFFDWYWNWGYPDLGLILHFFVNDDDLLLPIGVGIL